VIDEMRGKTNCWEEEGPAPGERKAPQSRDTDVKKSHAHGEEHVIGDVGRGRSPKRKGGTMAGEGTADPPCKSLSKGGVYPHEPET